MATQQVEKRAIKCCIFLAAVNKSNGLSVGRHERNHYGVTIFAKRSRRLIRDLFFFTLGIQLRNDKVSPF